MSHTTEFIDLSDDDAFVDAVPYEPNGRGVWAVTRYEDIPRPPAT